jgi:hypothetical protein
MRDHPSETSGRSSRCGPADPEHGLHVWIGPFEVLRALLLGNLRSDPFERAEYEGYGYNQRFAELAP